MADITEIARFWNKQSCGEIYAQGESVPEQLLAQEKARYSLEPFIFEFARFDEGEGADVLEIGVGMGADHAQWARAKPKSLTGIDLTDRAVEFTKARLGLEALKSNVFTANAENLPFPESSFDTVYSWGVLHHSQHPDKAINEVFRVLRPGGCAKVMIYHKYSIVGFILWLRYGAFRRKSLAETFAAHLESPGTHAYSVAEARRLFSQFASVKVSMQLSAGDLLTSQAGQRHQGGLLKMARRIWPRPLIRLFPHVGLFMLIEAHRTARI